MIIKDHYVSQMTQTATGADYVMLGDFDSKKEAKAFAKDLLAKGSKRLYLNGDEFNG